MKDRTRTICVSAWIDELGRDCQYALRALRRSPAFGFVTVVTLALGIGVNGTMFTVVNAMIRGLPVDGPDRIMSIDARDGAGRWRGLGASYLDFQDFRSGSRTFSALAAFSQTTATLGDEGRSSQRMTGSYVSANMFQLLGEKPIIGRDFESEDDRPGATPVVILGSRIWNARYDADSGVVGRTVRVNGLPSTVIGVMRDDFRFPVVSDLWQPLGLKPGLTSQSRGTRSLQVIGRLAGRNTRAQAQAEIQAIAARLSSEYPETNETISAIVSPFPGHFAPDPILIVLMTAVGFVLLVACANVANLFLARSAARSREIAIRLSLGATRWRIVRQLLVESSVVAIIAGASGFLLSLGGVWLFSKAVVGIGFPYYIRWTIDRSVLWFLAAVSLGAAMLFGLGPALQVVRGAAQRSATESKPISTPGPGGRRWTTALLVAELALTLILLAGAGLMLRSFVAVYRADRVVDAASTLVMPLSLPNDTYQTPEQRVAFYQRLQERVDAIRGVAAATFANVVPFAGGPSRQITIDGRQAAARDSLRSVSYVTIRAGYFETLGLRLLRGRMFTDADGAPGQESAIVNQRFATMLFPNDDPIGHRICLTMPNIREAGPPACATIVGISPAVRQQYFQEIDPVVYVPDRADSDEIMLIVRGDSVAALAPSIRAEVFALDPAISVNAIRPLDEFAIQSRWGHRVFGGMLAVFALVALVLAAVGLYSVTAFSIVQRTQEIGIRMALGAPSGAVVWLFVRRAALPLGIGLGVGLVGAVGVGRLLRRFLVQTSPTDLTTLIAITALLAAVSAAACFFPARRAARLDPVAALRYE